MKLLVLAAAMVVATAASNKQNYGRMDVARPTTLTFTSVADNSKCRLTKGAGSIDGTCDMSVPSGASIQKNHENIVGNKEQIEAKRVIIGATQPKPSPSP